MTKPGNLITSEKISPKGKKNAGKSKPRASFYPILFASAIKCCYEKPVHIFIINF